ncbi:MAG: hypothetical protein WC856_07720 [Methylococcaceae bacterium]|jgi:hypothetical protein
MSDFYTVSGVPSTGSAGQSSPIRSEFAAIETAMDKLPEITAHANEFWVNNAGATAVTTKTAAETRTALSLDIGTNVQAWDANLDQIAALAPTDNNFIVGNGTAWALETPVSARTSLGLAPTTTDNAILRADGTGGVPQNSGVIIDDLNNITGVESITTKNTGLKVKDSSNVYALNLTPGSAFSDNRTLTITTGDANRTLTLTGSPTISSAATKTQQMVSVSTDAFVTPSIQQAHPSAVKCWANVEGPTGAIIQGYNFDGITLVGTGIYGCNISTDFADTTYIAMAQCSDETTTSAAANLNINVPDAYKSPGSYQVHSRNMSSWTTSNIGKFSTIALGAQ